MIEIKNNAEVAELYIYGDIVSNSSEKWFDEVCPEDVIEELNGLGNKPLNIRISSYGGSVFGGISLFNILKSYKGYKTAIIDSCACSIASVIAMSADKIKMYDSSYLMIHRAWVGGACGNAEDLLKQAELLEQLDNTILDIYKTKLKADYPVEDLVDLINAESWLTAKECVEIFNDLEIIENEVLAFAKVDKQDFLNHLSNYKNVPESLKAQLEEEVKDEEQEVEDKIIKCPECDYEGKMPMDDEGFYICPECQHRFKLEQQQEENVEEEIVDEEEKKDNKIGELKIEEEDEDDDVIKIKFVNQQQEDEVVEDDCKKKPEDKCDDDKEKKCEIEEDDDKQQQEEEQVEETQEEEIVEPNKDDDKEEDEDVEDKCKKEKEKAQAQAKKELEFLKAKMFLDNFK